MQNNNLGNPKLKTILHFVRFVMFKLAMPFIPRPFYKPTFCKINEIAKGRHFTSFFLCAPLLRVNKLPHFKWYRTLHVGSLLPLQFSSGLGSCLLLGFIEISLLDLMPFVSGSATERL